MIGAPVGIIGTAVAAGLVLSVVALLPAALKRLSPPRPAPKRRAEVPSLASRVVVPTTAAAGTGAAIVLVTAGGASAPMAQSPVSAPSEKQVQLSVTAHDTTAQSARQPVAARPAATLTPAPQLLITPQSSSVDSPAPTAAEPTAAEPTATPSARPVTESPEPTPTAQDEPGLVDGLLGNVGGLVGGLLGG
ncbi:MAG TPA: hypothetical protein VLI04_13085 [Nocardioidaceae bacterium]|nr:hypothetical protein [Nocardioidaceae bacterium]